MRRLVLLLLSCGSACRTGDAEPESEPLQPDLGGAKVETPPKPQPPKVTKVEDPPRPAGTVSECPNALAGKEAVHRVIKKSCGAVPVTADYKIDGGSLTLEAGAKLQFSAGAGLQVGYYADAKLVVLGTEADPVVFSANGSTAPGSWRGIQLYGKATGSSIRHAIIEHAGDKKAALHVEAEHIVFESSRIRHAKGLAVEVRGAGRFDAFSANRIDDVGKVAMRVSTGAVGTIGAANTFPKDSVVQIERGVITGTATLGDIGAPWMIAGRIDIVGEGDRPAQLQIAAGTQLRFDGDGHISVGDGGPGGLAAIGEKGKEIVFAAHARTGRGVWRGVLVHSGGEARIAHAVFRHGGKKASEGVLSVDGGRIDLSDSTFESNAVAVVLKGDTLAVQRFETVAFKDTATAIDLPAAVLGALGSNTYEGEPIIAVAGGTIATEATWKKQTGAKVQLMGKLQIAKGKLTVQEGSTLYVKDGASIDVGPSDAGTLVLRGKADAPIAIVGMRDASGTWKGIVFHDKARGNVLAHVRLRNAGGVTAAVEAKGTAEVAIDGLVCEKCSQPALTWGCAAKVSHKGVEAREETPAAELPPEGCGT